METNQQEVRISLKAYLEYQELLEHRKEVKFIEETINTMADGKVNTGMTISWYSDFKCWSRLTMKLDSASERINHMIKERKELKEMSSREFRKWKRN